MNPMNEMMGGQPPPPPAFNAREAVNLPALFLIIFGALGTVFAVLSMVMYATGGTMVEPLLKMLRDVPSSQRDMILSSLKGTPLNYATTFISLVANAFIAFGAMQMRNLKSWSLGLAAAIVAMIPCLSCCCLVGLPLGIWAIVVLQKPEVKAQFT